MNTVPETIAKACLPEGVALPRGWLEAGLAVLDLTGAVQEMNPALSNWLGVSTEDAHGKPFRSLLAIVSPAWETTVPAFEQSGAVFVDETICHETATPRQWFKLEAAWNASGWFVRLNSTLPPLAEMAEGPWDEQLQSEHSRREVFIRMLRAEARLNNLIHHWPGVIFSQRADFSFAFVSPQIEQFTGVTLEQWRAQPHRFWDVVHESDAEDLQRQIRRTIQSATGVNSTYRIRHLKTGRVYYILEHRQAVLTESGMLLGYEGVWLDVTRQTIAEKRLSTASWKEALGVLTMGLAHDFSNVMAGIHALSESYAAQIGPEHAFYEGLELIKSNSMQASQLVHRIINLHHGKTGERSYQDLNTVTTDLADLVKKVLSRRVEFKIELAPESLPVYVDVVEFRQVIINLTLNAADAMGQGGKLVFRTSQHNELPPELIAQGTPLRLPAVRLSVQDTGHGIKAKHLSAIFDPFFTTKAMNKGSGLGLYNARLFIEKHRGAISVETTEGVGTTFHLWLPQSDFTEAEREITAASSRRHTLLVAGVTDRLLENTAEFLRSNGFFVVTAKTQEDAMELLEASTYNFAGVMVLVEDKAPVLGALVTDIQEKKLPLKIILQIIGCNQDELEAQLLGRADLVISPDIPEDDILERLNTTFSAETTASS